MIYFNDFSQTNYLKIYRIDLGQIFRIHRIKIGGARGRADVWLFVLHLLLTKRGR